MTELSNKKFSHQVTLSKNGLISWNDPHALSHHYAFLSPGKSSKDVLDVWVVSSRFEDSDAQFGIAECTNGCDHSGDNPHDESQPHRARILQNALWAHKDPWTDDVTWDPDKETGRVRRSGKRCINLSKVEGNISQHWLGPTCSLWLTNKWSVDWNGKWEFPVT